METNTEHSETQKRETEEKISGNPQVIYIKNANICTQGRHPEDILSNLCGNDFCFEGVQCGCMESFLQSLKVKDQQLQRKICECKVHELYLYSIPDWNSSLPLWWKGREIERHSTQYVEFLGEAYRAMFLWCKRFRDALMSTAGKQLLYDSEASDTNQAVLTDQEFCEILTHLRDTHIEEYKNCLYPRMWPNSCGVDEDYEF